MKRREFLSTLGAATLLTAVPGGWARGAQQDAPAYLAGWRSAPAQGHGRTPLITQGRLPSGLRGTLYRNGPACFERDGLRYKHWFDGDGMINAWRLADDGAQHTARFIQTHKYQAEQTAGRFVYPAAGTHIPDARPIGNPDDLNTANTSIIEHNGRLFALWEAGSAHEIEAGSLATRGTVSWRDDLEAMPFSAHPLTDAKGEMWNFGHIGYMSEPQLLLYQIGANGKLKRAKLVPIGAPGYIHSFVMSENYLVFVFAPYVQTGMSADTPFFDSLKWRPERGCLSLIVDKRDMQVVKRHQLPAGAVYHWIDAREQGDELVLRGCWHDDGGEAISPFADYLAGTPDPSSKAAGGRVVEARLPRKREQAELRTLWQDDAEFPESLPDGGFVTVGSQAPRNSARYANAVQRFAHDGSTHSAYRYGTDVMIEEQRSVRVGTHTYLIGTVLDYGRGRSGISVLDADQLAAGPIYQAWAPYTVPLGFHGHFVQA